MDLYLLDCLDTKNETNVFDIFTGLVSFDMSYIDFRELNVCAGRLGGQVGRSYRFW